MYIKIARKLQLFSHTPGISCLLPRTLVRISFFPTCLQVEGLEPIHFSLTGPVKEFTVEVDVEKDLLRVFGQAQEGFFRYLLFAENNSLVFYLEKGPLPFPLKEKKVLLSLSQVQRQPSQEKLSLGSHRKADWELLCRRLDLREILPFWLLFGQILPSLSAEKIPEEGNYLLLAQLRETIARSDKNRIETALLSLFQAGFSGIFLPQLSDPRFLGLSPAVAGSAHSFSSFSLLEQSAQLIRSLFFRERERKFYLLPCVPPSLHCGRYLSLMTSEGDRLDLEWSKKLLRRALIVPGATREVELHLQASLDTYRCRRDLRSQGEMRKRGEPLLLTQGETLYLDRFQK